MELEFSKFLVDNEDEFIRAVNYIADECTKLCNKIVGTNCPIKYLTVFAHKKDEYEKAVKILSGMGDLVDANNGKAARLNKPIRVQNGVIPRIRVRKPDEERPQVGCCDYDIKNYEEFKTEYLNKNPNNLFLIKREDYEMIEFRDGEFDVLGYVVSRQL